LVDGPRDQTGVHRQQYNFKRLSLTPIKLSIPRNARLSTLTKAFKTADVLGQWAKSGTAQRFANQKIRRTLSDFDRFKLMLLKKKVRVLSLRARVFVCSVSHVLMLNVRKVSKVPYLSPL